MLYVYSVSISFCGNFFKLKINSNEPCIYNYIYVIMYICTFITLKEYTGGSTNDATIITFSWAEKLIRQLLS